MLGISKEKEKFNLGYKFVAGTDEVGRGSLAGPVVAATVVFDSNLERIRNTVSEFKEVNDSKQVKEEKRELLSSIIKLHSSSWSVGIVPPSEIDEINIHVASLKAMDLSVTKVAGKVAKNKKLFLFVDGRFQIPDLSVQQGSVIGGDGKIFSIACASIVAKVFRDSLMKKLHVKLPEYDFATHKGYATKKHEIAIKKFGLSTEHRKTFCKKYLV